MTSNDLPSDKKRHSNEVKEPPLSSDPKTNFREELNTGNQDPPLQAPIPNVADSEASIPKGEKTKVPVHIEFTYKVASRCRDERKKGTPYDEIVRILRKDVGATRQYAHYVSHMTDNKLEALISKCEKIRDIWRSAQSRLDIVESTNPSTDHSEDPYSKSLTEASTPTLTGKKLCPICGKELKRKRLLYRKNSKATPYYCVNRTCPTYDPKRGYGGRFTDSILAGDLDRNIESNKRLSNTLTRQQCYDAFFLNLIEGKTCEKVQEIIGLRFGIKVPISTLRDIIERVCKHQESKYCSKEFIENCLKRGLLGYQIGTSRHFYMEIDATPFVFNDPLRNESYLLYLYLALDYPSGIVLGLEISTSRNPKITETLLQKVFEAGYVPDLVISDRGTDVRPAIETFIALHSDRFKMKHGFDRLHRIQNIREALIFATFTDPLLGDFRRQYGNQLISLLYADKEGMLRGIERLKKDEIDWSRDEVTKKQVQSFLDDAEHYLVPMEFSGAPRDCQLINNLCSELDKKKTKQEIGKTVRTWTMQVPGIIGNHNRTIWDEFQEKYGEQGAGIY